MAVFYIEAPVWVKAVLACSIGVDVAIAYRKQVK